MEFQYDVFMQLALLIAVVLFVVGSMLSFARRENDAASDAEARSDVVPVFYYVVNGASLAALAFVVIRLATAGIWLQEKRVSDGSRRLNGALAAARSALSSSAQKGSA